MRRRRPYKIVCADCGKSDRLEYRAFAFWNPRKQRFVVDDLDWDYAPFCGHCQCDVEIAEVNLDTQEIIKYGLMEFDEDT